VEIEDMQLESRTTLDPPSAHARDAAARWPLIVGPIWLIAVLAGLAFIWQHADTPGTAAEAQAKWPSDSRVQLSDDGKTLVMFAHPHCPCTKASMAELERIVAQCNGKQATAESRVTPWIVFYKPSTKEAGWEQTDLWRTAESIPGAHVLCDEDGAEAKRFDAKTSGQTFLFDKQGEGLFGGGITSARGHEGDSLGHDAIVDFAHERNSVCRATPVFGCPITEAKKSQ
jgi:hypothetical protein